MKRDDLRKAVTEAKKAGDWTPPAKAPEAPLIILPEPEPEPKADVPEPKPDSEKPALDASHSSVPEAPPKPTPLPSEVTKSAHAVMGEFNEIWPEGYVAKLVASD